MKFKCKLKSVLVVAISNSANFQLLLRRIVCNESPINAYPLVRCMLRTSCWEPLDFRRKVLNSHKIINLNFCLWDTNNMHQRRSVDDDDDVRLQSGTFELRDNQKRLALVSDAVIQATTHQTWCWIAIHEFIYECSLHNRQHYQSGDDDNHMAHSSFSSTQCVMW